MNDFTTNRVFIFLCFYYYGNNYRLPRVVLGCVAPSKLSSDPEAPEPLNSFTNI